MLAQLKKELGSYSDASKAKFYPRFFKSGKGEYAEGDKFIGVTVPKSRNIAIKYREIPLKDLSVLISSPIHEERLVALLILVEQFKKGDEVTKEKIYNFYLGHMKYVNNWDLVDLSADRIVGGYLLDSKSTPILTRLSKSKILWERRIAIIATFQFIKANKEYKKTFEIAHNLLHDKEDLIHKAVGWMLREVGKRISVDKEEEFLKTYYKIMPRTMLRYAIEHFDENKRQKYLKGII